MRKFSGKSSPAAQNYFDRSAVPWRFPMKRGGKAAARQRADDERVILEVCL